MMSWELVIIAETSNRWYYSRTIIFAPNFQRRGGRSGGARTMKYTPPSSIMIIALASSLSLSTTRRGAVAGAVASAAGRRISLDAAPVVPAFALGGGGRHPHRRCGQLDRASPRDRPSSSSSSSFAITSSSGGFGVSSSHVRASSPSIGTSRRIASDVGDDYAATDRLVDIDIVGAEEVEAVDWGEIDDEEEEDVRIRHESEDGQEVRRGGR